MIQTEGISEHCLVSDIDQRETVGRSCRREPSGTAGPLRAWGAESRILEEEEEGGGCCDSDTCCYGATCWLN